MQIMLTIEPSSQTRHVCFAPCLEVRVHGRLRLRARGEEALHEPLGEVEDLFWGCLCVFFWGGGGELSERRGKQMVRGGVHVPGAWAR